MCKKVLENAPEDFPPRPFCSPHCKLADLHNWLGERYRIPGEDLTDVGTQSPTESDDEGGLRN